MTLPPPDPFDVPPVAPSSAAGHGSSATRRPSPRVQPIVGLATVVGVVSLFQNWSSTGFFRPGEAFQAGDIPVQFLWDTIPASFDDPSLLFVLVPGLVLAAVGSVWHRLRGLAALGGLVLAATAVAYILQVRSLLHDPRFDIRRGLLHHVGVGAWACLATGVVLVVSSLIAWARRGHHAG